jgi:hypothetical protein
VRPVSVKDICGRTQYGLLTAVVVAITVDPRKSV